MNEERERERVSEGKQREIEWRMNEYSADERAEGGKCGGGQEEGATSDSANPN